MECNPDLTYWKNYQIAMQWIQGNNSIVPPASLSTLPIVADAMIVEEEGEEDELEFTIDDELLEFYRHSKDHRANRSK